jgi:hypothetical protein
MSKPSRYFPNRVFEARQAGSRKPGLFSGLLVLSLGWIAGCGANPTTLQNTVSQGQNASCIPGSWGCNQTGGFFNPATGNPSCQLQGEVSLSGQTLKKFLCYPLLVPSGQLFLSNAPQLGPSNPTGGYATNTSVRAVITLLINGSTSLSIGRTSAAVNPWPETRAFGSRMASPRSS